MRDISREGNEVGGMSCINTESHAEKMVSPQTWVQRGENITAARYEARTCAQTRPLSGLMGNKLTLQRSSTMPKKYTTSPDATTDSEGGIGVLRTHDGSSKGQFSLLPNHQLFQK